MAKSLPKKIFVYRENEGTDDEFFNVALTPQGISVQDGEILVGIYTLEKIATAVNKTEIVQ